MVAQSEVAPHIVQVAIQADLRFLRFQAPWASGKKVFILLRSTPAERWVNIRHRLLDVAGKRECTHSCEVRRNMTNTGFWKWKNVLSRLENWDINMVLSWFGGGVKQEFFQA